MPKDNGLYVLIAAVLFFYIRLINQQRIKMIAERKERERVMRLTGKKPVKKSEPASSTAWLDSLTRKDVLFIIIGAGFMALGSLEHAGIPSPDLQSYWWAFASIGVVFLSFGARV